MYVCMFIYIIYAYICLAVFVAVCRYKTMKLH